MCLRSTHPLHYTLCCRLHYIIHGHTTVVSHFPLVAVTHQSYSYSTPLTSRPIGPYVVTLPTLQLALHWSLSVGEKEKYKLSLDTFVVQDRQGTLVGLK